MVNRSKPSVSAHRMNEGRQSSLLLENSVLKTKNVSLAKELANYKQKYTNLFNENVKMSSKLFEVEALNMKLMQVIKRINSYGKLGLSKLVGISDDMSHILQETAQIMYTPKEFNEVQEVNLQSCKSDTRTRVVKPMVGGHTIARPTITLQRVTLEQLEQLRNYAITKNSVNAGESNSDMNERADLLAHRRMSPLNVEQNESTSSLCDEFATDYNEEDNDVSINEESRSTSANFNRLSTLPEESIKIVTQNSSCRRSNNTSNSLNSTGNHEARVNLSSLSKPATPMNNSLPQINLTQNPVVKLHPFSSQQSTNHTISTSKRSRNSTKEVNNPQVNLYQLSPAVLKSFSPSNKENVNENRFTSSSGELSTRYLRVPTRKKDFNCSTTNSNDISILNDTTVRNSWTQSRENGIDTSNNDNDALEDDLNISTVVNLSFDTNGLPDRLESVEDLTHSGTVESTTEQEILAKTNEKSQSCNTFTSNASVEVTCESDALTSCSNKLPEGLTFQDKSTSLTPKENRKSYGDTSSCDPLEGPSTLLDGRESLEAKLLLLHNLGLSSINNTSTPYASGKITFRRKPNYTLYTPPVSPLPSKVLRKRATLKKSSPVSSFNVERHSPKRSSINIKSEKFSLDKYTNCSVHIKKLSYNQLRENLENMSKEESERTFLKRKSSPSKNLLIKDLENMSKEEKRQSPERTSLKRKPSPSKKKKSEKKRNLRNKLSPVKFSPRKRRTRICVPGTFKEPSLIKKLRRSK